MAKKEIEQGHRALRTESTEGRRKKRRRESQRGRRASTLRMALELTVRIIMRKCQIIKSEAISIQRRKMEEREKHEEHHEADGE